MLPTLPVLILAALLLLEPDRAAAAVQEGLFLCVQRVIPALFPFFVVVSLLLKLGVASWLQPLFAPFMGPVFHLRGACALPLLTGFLGGYPSGAQAAAELYRQGHLSRTEAELLLGFCDNCGLSFLLGYLGAGVLGDSATGGKLFLVHATAALLTGGILCRLPRRSAPPALPDGLPAPVSTFPQALTAAVGGSTAAILNVCAFIVIFRVLTALLPLGQGWYLGFLEMVTGCSALPTGRKGFILAAVLTGWGGLSVHCQAMSVAAPLSFHWHWVGKFLQMLLSAGIAALLTI